MNCPFAIFGAILRGTPQSHSRSYTAKCVFSFVVEKGLVARDARIRE